MGIPRAFDLRHNSERLVRTPWKRGPFVDCILFPSQNTSFAIIVGKVTGYSLVQRNHLKRQLRSLAREVTPSFYTLIIRAKKTAYDQSYEELKHELTHMVSTPIHS